MGVHIDEARRDDQPGGVDLALADQAGRLPGGVAPGDDQNPVSQNCDVSQKPWLAAAIDDFAIADHQVVSGFHVGLLLSRWVATGVRLSLSPGHPPML